MSHATANTTRTLFTCEEFEELCLENRYDWCELIDGEIVNLPPPGGIDHGEVTINISIILGTFVKRKRLLGRVAGNEVGIILNSDPPRVRGADALYLSYARFPKGRRERGFLRVPPELIVEVYYKEYTWTRMKEKIRDYHDFGVDMVWVADPRTRTVRKFPRGGEPETILPNGSIDGGKILPGFKVRIAEFFEE